MLKEIQVVMLATEKASNLYTHKSCMSGVNNLMFTKNITWQHEGFARTKEGTFYHLYFLSDEEIKEGDWTIIKGHTYKYPVKVKSIIDGIVTFYTDKVILLSQPIKDCPKIIATTDSSLTVGEEIYSDIEDWEKKKHGFKLSLPTCSEGFIQKYIERYNAGKPIEKVMVEYEEKVSKSINKEQFPDIVTLKLRGNEIIIKPIKDTFTREELTEVISERNINHLQWIYDRLIHVHKEDRNYDYMHKLKSIIDSFKTIV